MKKKLKDVLIYLFPLLIGAGILYYLYQGIDFEQIIQVVRTGMKWEWILSSFFILAVGHIIRALRWRLQLEPLHIKPRSVDLINSVFGGYAVNLILPRLGEIWRCNFMAKRTQSEFAPLFGSLLSERLFDILATLAIIGLTFTVQFRYLVEFIRTQLYSARFEYLFLLLSLAGSLLLIFLGIIFWKRHSLLRFSFVQKIADFLQKLFLGVKTLAQMRGKVVFVLLTVLIWICYFFNFYVCFFAFDFTQSLGIKSGLLAFTMGTIAVIAPVQGGTGPWHFMIITTLIYLGVTDSDAAIFALVVHAIQQLFVLILGAYAFISIYLTKTIKDSHH